MKGLLLLIVFFAVTSCIKPKPHNGVVCTEEARAGLNVLVIDGKTGQYLADSVTVIATTAASSQSLMPFGSNPSVFAGAYEQTGTFTLSASRPGYHPSTTAPVTVTKDECHVIAQSVTLTLHR